MMTLSPHDGKQGVHPIIAATGMGEQGYLDRGRAKVLAAADRVAAAVEDGAAAIGIAIVEVPGVEAAAAPVMGQLNEAAGGPGAAIPAPQGAAGPGAADAAPARRRAAAPPRPAA